MAKVHIYDDEIQKFERGEQDRETTIENLAERTEDDQREAAQKLNAYDEAVTLRDSGLLDGYDDDGDKGSAAPTAF